MKCGICGIGFIAPGKGYYRYCPNCREKIARGELDKKRNAYWLTQPERTRERAEYHRKMRIRKKRYQEVDDLRKQGIKACYWCKGTIAKERLRHNAEQQFCSRKCFGMDQRERGTLSDRYFRFSKFGNKQQKEIRLLHGPSQKRKDHMMKVNEARRARRKGQ